MHPARTDPPRSSRESSDAVPAVLIPPRNRLLRRPVGASARPGGRWAGVERVLRRFDGRSAAVLLSTAGSLPLPLFALLDPTLTRAGGLGPLVGVWVFTVVVFTTTAVVGRLGDRLFTVFGLIGMVGIAVGAWAVTDPVTSGVVMTLLGAIPAIAAMSSSRRVVVAFSLVAIACAVVVAFLTPSTAIGMLVRCGTGVANVVIPVFIVSALRTSLEVSMQRYAVLGDTDPLTGLLNRRGFLARSGGFLTEVADARHQIGFLLIDVDHFKDINDRLGHAAGDAVLVDTVRAILRSAPRGSLIGRFGGEEFVVLCSIEGQTALAEAAETIRTTVSTTTAVTVSLGGVAAPLSVSRTGTTNISEVVDHLTHLADRWVYVAKSAGRDRVVCLATSPIHYVAGDAEPPRMFAPATR